MSQPIAQLAERFSEPGADATPWTDTAQALSAELFWLTTVRADGRPHVTPLVAAWHEDAIYFSTGPGEQKVYNLEHARKVALTTGNNAWATGLDVVVEGTAVEITDGEDLKQIADVFDAKYGSDSGWHLDVIDGVAQVYGHPAIVYRVDPAKVIAFGKGPHTQTTYRFGA